MSLQLGTGAYSAYASYNPSRHNVVMYLPPSLPRVHCSLQVRDSLVICLAHMAWSLPSLLLTLSLTSSSSALSLLSSLSLLHSSLLHLRVGWLWASLLLILLLLTSLSSTLGHLEVITSSLLQLLPSLTPLRPLLSVLPLCLLSSLSLLVTIQGGPPLHSHLSSLLSWPPLAVSLLTLMSTLLCHGTSHLLRDLTELSSLLLPNWTTVHLSFLYYTLLPLLLSCSLYSSLSSLPSSLAWLPLLSLLPLGLGATYYLVKAASHRPANMVSTPASPPFLQVFLLHLFM